MSSKKTLPTKISANSARLELSPLDCAGQVSNSPPILVPISIQGQNTLALLDTGAACSFISPTFYSTVSSDAPLPISVSIETIMQGSTFHPVGISAPLELCVGTSAVPSSFLIADITHDHQVILGRELISKLGITIGNLPANFPRHTQLPSDASNQNFEWKPPSAYAQPISDSEAHTLEQELKEPLLLNKQTSNKFCNVPEALVHLDTGAAKASFVKQYRIPHQLLSVYEETVGNWLKKGIITQAPVGCAWNSSLIAVPKKDTSGNLTKHRICLDPRHINKLLADDKFPIPTIKELLDRLSGASYFSSLDLEWSYHQFLVNPSDQQKTAFTFNSQQYMFIGTPFGLKTITSVFQRVTSSLFKDLPYVIVYVDDILVFSSSIEEHISHVKEVC